MESLKYAGRHNSGMGKNEPEDGLHEVAVDANEELSEALDKANQASKFPPSIAIAMSKVEDAHVRLSKELDEFPDPDE